MLNPCFHMALDSNRSFTYLSILVLMIGALWAWWSRAPAQGTTGGLIPAPQKGFLAPDFALETAEGKTIRLSELRGQPVVLNIWASWCGPCRAEMPALQRVYQAYQAQGLEILGLNSTAQDDRQLAQAFVAEQGLTFPILFDTQGEATRLYAVRALPTTYFIDAQGVIQEVVTGGPMAEALLRIRVEQLIEASLQEKP
jgi:cytochrome c biogenesis protein CcmG/thiol:disulfide interchange protein DsbE